jgi:3-hydroxyacyl-[acyl-carrier-protein] dehydratase
MLKEDLYIIQDLVHDGNHINAIVALNAAHKIFEGHFPGQPVLPGVCMMQMMRELLETVLHKPLQLSRAANIKFISLVVPTITCLVNIQASYKIKDDLTITLNASAKANEEVYFKFQGVYSCNTVSSSKLGANIPPVLSPSSTPLRRP